MPNDVKPERKRLRSYRDLEVWQLGVDLVQAVYALTRAFPADERFGLTSQLHRAAVSVPTNVAEGYGRSHRGDYLRFLSFSRGSVCEVESLLIVSHRLGFAPREDLIPVWKLLQRIGQMLLRLMRSLRPADPTAGPPPTDPKRPR